MERSDIKTPVAAFYIISISGRRRYQPGICATLDAVESLWQG